MESSSLKSEASDSTSSTTSTIPQVNEHPPTQGQDHVIVYFEQRNFHRSPDDGTYLYRGRLIDEEAAHDILIDALQPPEEIQDPIVYIRHAMVRMSVVDSALQQADRKVLHAQSHRSRG